MFQIILCLAALANANRLLTQRAGAVGEASPVTDAQLSVWADVLERDMTNDLGVSKTDLQALGTPVTVQTQVVAGTNYYFTFANGEKVTVWEQTWTNKLEITAVTEPEPVLGKNGIGPSWTYDNSAEMPEGVKDMGGYTVRYYTPEQQARLGVTETGEQVQTQQLLGEDPATWGPQSQPKLGEDPATWSPSQPKLGEDPATWGPQQPKLGEDPKTWSPSQPKLGEDPATWGPESQPKLGEDPATWGPQQPKLGEDPETWSPSQPEDNTELSASALFNMLMPRKTYTVPGEEEPQMLGQDPSTWSPSQPKLGEDPATWGPQSQPKLGEDPATWSPSQPKLGEDPATWSPSQPKLGEDPATWGPQSQPKLGEDPATWSPPQEEEPVLGRGGVGPRWTWDPNMEKPAGVKDMGDWQMSVYTEEQQERLGVTETGEQFIGGEGGIGPESTWEDDDDQDTTSDRRKKVEVVAKFVKGFLGL